MMTHKDKRGGSLILDVRIRGVGRIKRASGTHDPAVLRRMTRDLHDVASDGRLDVVRAVRDGTVSLTELRDAVRRKAVDRLALGAAARPLVPTWTAWVDKKDCSTAHRRSLMQSLRHLKARESTTVSDVATLLDGARERLAKHPQSFRLARAAAQAFVKATCKRSHPLYADVSAVEPLKIRAQRHKHPATVSELHAIIQNRMEPVDFHAANIASTMALTGMRPNEMWGDWDIDREANGVRIRGTKTQGAVRTVPLVTTWLFKPELSYVVFRKAFRDASDGQMTPYDLRRTYANWLEAAGIPRTRRRLYLGHGASDVTDLYEAHEVRAFLAADAEKLRAFLGETGQQRKMEVVK